MKLPKISKMFRLTPRKKYNNTAAARRVAPPMDDDDIEPQTKLSSAFVVVLILHVVAVGGIYAFNSIKAHRKPLDPLPAAPTLVAKTSPTAPSIAPKLPAAEPVPAAPVPALAAVSSSSGPRIHHVKKGENLTRIATQYGVTAADLEEANGPKNVATLHEGQALTIPKPKPATALAKKGEETPKVGAAAKVNPKTYTVAKGDNPVAIARKFGVSQDELLKLNNIDDPKKLQIGQTLKVPAKKN